MIKLLMIADDFSGALDAGVQFAARGAATRVVTDLDCDFLETDAEVLVMVAETRHLPPQKAYDVVYHVARNAREAGVPYIYKKTDSALRGECGQRAGRRDGCGGRRCDAVPAGVSQTQPGDAQWRSLCGRRAGGGEYLWTGPL